MAEDVKLLLCPFCNALPWMQCHGGIFADGKGMGWRVECAGQCHAMTCYWHTKAEAIAAWNTRATLEEKPENFKELYHELLLAVGNKYEGETRHQTALRYIQQAERGPDQACAASADDSKGEPSVFGDASGAVELGS